MLLKKARQVHADHLENDNFLLMFPKFHIYFQLAFSDNLTVVNEFKADESGLDCYGVV